ncbi:MAG: PA14 domain-containing protein [Limisphaerales bacterium]
MQIKSLKKLTVLASVLLGLGGATSYAGGAFFNLDTAPDPSEFFLVGNAAWQPSLGAFSATNQAFQTIVGQTNSGFIKLTDAGGQSAAVLFPDFDHNQVVKAFDFKCMIKLGDWTSGCPADGFSVNYVSSDDPIVANVEAGNNPGRGGDATTAGWAGSFDNGGNEYNLPEEGGKTGIGIGFDTWAIGDPNCGGANGPNDLRGISIRVNGVQLTQIAMPSVSGGAPILDPTDFHSLFTGPADTNTPGDGAMLSWVPLEVSVDENGVLNVFWKNHQIVTNLTTGFFPIPGRIIFGASTGGSEQFAGIDNISISTVPANVVLIEGVKGSAIGFAINTQNSGSSAADTNTIQLSLNGTAVTPTSITTTANGTTTIAYKNPASPFQPGATNSVTLTMKDTGGNVVGPTTRTYVVPGYVTIPAAYAVTGVDTSKPGFLIHTYQVTNSLDNEINLSEAVLHGDAGANVADLSSFTNGVNQSHATAGTINYSRLLDAGTVEAAGDWQERLDLNGSPLPNSRPDQQLPGLPSVSNLNPDGTIYNNNAAMEILTYLQFPKAGLYKLIINSDDGFRLQIGNGDAARDQLNSLILSQFDGGRGASDSSQTVYVPQAGFYAVRLLWFQGGGGANVEFTAVNDDGPGGADGTTALVNDSTVTGSLLSYRVRTGDTPPVVTYLTPVRAADQVVRPENNIYAEITDGSKATVTSGSVTLTVNGSAVTPTVSKSGSVTKVSYAPPGGVWPSGATLTNVLIFSDNGTPAVLRTNTWMFTTLSYRTVPPSLALPASAVDTTKPGFLIKTFQVGISGHGADLTAANPEIGLPNSTYMAETLIHGLWGWPNTADLTSFTGPAGWHVETDVVNYNGSGGNAGDFADPNAPNMPGIPGTALNEGGVDNYALEMLTVVNFAKAGLYTMDVNSDDGFRVIAGNRKDAFYYVLGEANYGKGASDVLFTFQITKPGLYPLRLLYEEGGGGNNVEWSLENIVLFTNGVAALNSGSFSLINDATDGKAVKAYQYPILTTKGSPYVKWFVPPPTGNSYSGFVPGTHANADSDITGMRPGPDTAIHAILVDGETVIDTATVKLAVDGVSVTPTVTKDGTNTTVFYQPPTPLSSGSADNIHTVDLTYLDRTLSWSFQVGTIPTPSFFIEAADFNYDNGKSQPVASQMPYIGGAYAGLGATKGVDYVGAGDNDNPYYRYPNSLQVPMSFANDRDRGMTAVQVDFRLGWIGSGQWYNYTRTIPAGNYNVYAAISYDDTQPHQLYAQLQQVGGDITTTNQTVTELGTFDAPGTHNQGGWGSSTMVPLMDASGMLASLSLSGTTTLRYNLPNAGTNVVGGVTNVVYGGSGDWDYMVFVPAKTLGPQFSSIQVSGANVIVTWSGGGTLQQAPALGGTWTDLTGKTSPATVPIGSNKTLYFRIR